MRRLLPEPAAELDDDGLAEAYRAPNGPFLRVNFIASLDGATTVAGVSKGLQQPGDLRIFTMLRALADVVLVGHGTAAAEGYGPMTAGPTIGELRISLGRPPTAPIAVVSRRASLDPASPLVVDAVSPTILVTCAAADAERRRVLEAAGVPVVVAGDDEVDLPLARRMLGERGLEHVLCEGGPTLLRTALIAGVVDELGLSIAPALVGDGTRLIGDALPDVVRLGLRSLLEEDGMLFARYGVSR